MAAPAPSLPMNRNRPLWRAWVIAVACLWLLGVGAGLGHAGEWRAAPTAMPRAVLQEWRLPPGPLGAVLQNLARQGGVLVSWEPALLQGLASRGLEAKLPLVEALATLLAPHGLEASEDEPDSFRVRRAAAAPSAVAALAATLVIGQRPEPDGVPLGPDRRLTKSAVPWLREPQSSSVVTGAEMRERGARTVTQALQYVPGVQLDNFGGQEVRNDWVVLRGFDAKMTGDYRDGLSQLPYDQIRARMPTYALEGLEVVRGPASSLHGAMAPGGLVNRLTKVPRAEPLREVGVQLGSFGAAQGFLDIGGAWSEQGHASYRLTATARRAGTREQYDDDHRYRDDLAYVAPAFRWQDGDTDLVVLAHAQRDRNDGESRAFFPTRTLVGDYGYDVNRRQFQSLGYHLEHGLADGAVFRQSVRVQHGEMLLRNLYPVALAADGRTLSRRQLQAQERAVGVVADQHWQGQLAWGTVHHTLRVGLALSHLDGRQHYRQAAAPPLDVIEPRYGQVYGLPADAPAIIDVRQISSQWGAYLQDEIEAGAWTVVLGLRRDGYRERTTDQLAGTRQVVDKYANNYRVAVSYDLVSGLVPYASLSTAFLPQPGVAFDGRPFAPSRARQLEAGVKLEPVGSLMRYAVAVFDLEQRDALTPDPAPARPGFSVTTGRMRTRGLELEASLAWSEGWSLQLAYTYNDVKKISSEDGGQGRMPIVTPRQMAGAWLERRVTSGPLTGWRAGAGLRYVGTTYVDVANKYKNPASLVVDASLGYDTGAWRLALDVGNLFDRQSVVCRNDWMTCRYGVERMVFASASYRY